MVASGASQNAFLSLIGGEPFIIKQTWQLLEALSQRGVAKNIYVGLLTKRPVAQLEAGRARAALLRGMSVSVSIDGHGALYEYLRHGASWKKLIDTLDWLTRFLRASGWPRRRRCRTETPSAWSPLLRVLDDYGLQVTYNTVTWPARLQATNLPPQLSGDSLCSACARTSNPSAARATSASVRGYCELLEEPGDQFDEELFREFMTFTNDLDARRGERLGDVAPEAVRADREAGIEWSDEHHRHHHQPTTSCASSRIPVASTIRTRRLPTGRP